MLKKCCAELLGTFYLILLCVGAANSRVFVYLPTPQHPLYFLPIAMAFGFGAFLVATQIHFFPFAELQSTSGELWLSPGICKQHYENLSVIPSPAGIGGIVHLLSNSSGGHVNPAVTLALTLDGRCSLIQCIFYIIFQFLGGFIGAG